MQYRDELERDREQLLIALRALETGMITLKEGSEEAFADLKRHIATIDSKLGEDKQPKAPIADTRKAQ